MAIPRNYPSPVLLPDSNYFFWKDRMIHLPRDVANGSLECKKKFIQILKNTETFSLRKLTPEESESAFSKAWEEMQKNLPTNDHTRTILMVIKIAGIAFLIIIGSKASL